MNVFVLFPVIRGLLAGSPGMTVAFGRDAPARRIPIAVYLAIAALSAVLPFAPQGWREAFVPGMLAVQMVYKFATLSLLGIRHPVAMANLGIGALHAVTLWTVLR